MEAFLENKDYFLENKEDYFLEHKEVFGVPFNEFTDPQNQLVNSEKHNAYDLYCSNGCQILILRANFGKWVERSNEKVRETSFVYFYFGNLNFSNEKFHCLFISLYVDS